MIATWIQIPEPTIIEILNNTPLDMFIIDMEHSYISNEKIASLMRVVDPQKKVLVRVESNDELKIRQALDLGADGIIVPMVDNQEEAERVVYYSKYPPLGKRGTSFCRMNQWGVTFKEYQEKSNKELLNFVMLETAQSIDNAESIIGTNGIDGVFIGSYDLSSSLGKSGELYSQEMLDIEAKIVGLCSKYNKKSGILVFVPNEANILNKNKTGFDIISVGGDVTFLQSSANHYLKVAKSCGV